MMNKYFIKRCLASLLVLTLVLIQCLCLCGCKDLFGNLFSGNEEVSADAARYLSMNDTQRVDYLTEQIVSAAESGKSEAVFDFDCSDELFRAYNRVLLDNPGLFWLAGTALYNKTKLNERIRITLHLESDITAKEKEIRKEKVNNAVNLILSNVDENGSDYDKVLYIHDYLTDNVVYDSESSDIIINSKDNEDIPDTVEQSASLYGALVNKKAVCSGYSAAFMYLANRLGLDCIRINGIEKEKNINHQWNCVKVDGDYYYIDVTWDDLDSDAELKFGRSYEFFLINYNELTETHIIDEDINPPECTAQKYNYYIYNGLYLEKYTKNAFSDILSRNENKDCVSVKFSSDAECKRAYDLLFESGKQIWEMPSVENRNLRTVNTAVSYSGRILTIKFG